MKLAQPEDLRLAFCLAINPETQEIRRPLVIGKMTQAKGLFLSETSALGLGGRSPGSPGPVAVACLLDRFRIKAQLANQLADLLQI